MSMRSLFEKFGPNERGVTAIEFAIVAPVFLALIMGGLDFGHTLYMQAVLQGTVQKAARDSSLATGAETAKKTIIDGNVRSAVRDLNTSLTDNDIQITRTSYGDFTQAQAAQPEDANQDGVCSPGEVWIDRNFNDVYDANGGSSGSGGAKDVLVYSVRTSYPRLFPVAALIGFSPNVNLSATTVMANQPYGDQVTRAGSLTPRNCP
ncbi:tight adherence protein TadE [Sphingobium sp. SCG-1]|uniref:TadE/TadG family type IV pilus assembly protein n=1 Tax=Sphingobium sp. SCG-1 TaxID=2072936 RepID=UPI000CD69E81|nr:TadE/TadG family type IV pilus assembly protein [Sphingobium sp. SCG-1]AUW59122.1 tight adherence protein TadE [Sphingobium sp. SCG-1]